MTSEPDLALTVLRPRLTAAPAGPVGAELPLSEAAEAVLTRVCGGRAPEELVLLSAATTLVVAAAEATGEPAVAVAGPEGPVLLRHELAGLGSVGDLVRATDAALRRAQPAGAVGGAVLVRSTAIGQAAPDGTPVELTLTSAGTDGRTLVLHDGVGQHERWFLEILLRAVDAVLAGLTEAGRPLATVPLAAGPDVAAALAAGAANFAPTPVDTTLLAPIRAVVAEDPGRLAVVVGESRLDYGELWRAAGAVAAHLVALGVRRGDRVAVLTGKSVEALPAILGVLRAGAAYVPLDHRSPAGRLADMVADAGCRAVLTAGGLGELLPPDRVSAPLVDVAAVPASADTGSDLPEAGPDDLAYVIYTSGSTGTPKGVGVPHRAIAAYVRWKVAYDALDADSRVLLLPSLAFDSSVSDLFPALAAGAALVLADAQQSLPRDLVATAVRHGVTHATIVPSLYRLLLPHLAGGSALKLVTVAGEATDAALVARHHAMLPGVRLVNEYGPTENSVCATAFDHRTDAGPGFPIGRPIATTVVRIADPAGRALPAGFVGELLLTGHGLAEGYHGNPDLTAAAFTPDPEAAGGRWYHTHDLAWWRPDGIVEFAGRSDDQVKIRGHRIELGEIEAVLSAAEGVETAAVVVAEDAAGAPMLVAFLQAPEQAVDVARRAVADRLPPAMMPGAFRTLPAIPRLPSGKPDRRALAARAAEPATEPPASAAGVGDGDELIAIVAEIFQSVLGGPVFGPDDDFILRGGHSLMALSAIARIEEKLGVFIDVGDFLDFGTPREIADLVRRSPGGQTPAVQAVSGGESLRRLLGDTLDARG